MSSIEYDLSTDDSDDDALNLPGLASDGVPGLLVSVVFDDTLSAPVVDNGTVRMPRSGGSSKLVEFGSGIASPISGVLVGMNFATGIGEIFAKNGEVYFPLAEYNGYYGTNVAGALVGVQYVTGITAPRINNGMLELPEAGGAEVQAAEFVGTITTSVEPGGLRGAEFVSFLNEPQARSGIFQIPLADNVYFSTAVAGGVIGASYASGIDSPRVYFGEVQFPMPGDSMLQGVYDINGVFHKWVDVQGYAGSQIPVAFVPLSVNGTSSIPLLLSVGFDGAGLSFFLSDSFPS